LVGGKGDWFGCEQLGYFLVPRFGRYRKDCPDTISVAWEKAFGTLSSDAASPMPFSF
jgi:hypothetical protein